MNEWEKFLIDIGKREFVYEPPIVMEDCSHEFLPKEVAYMIEITYYHLEVSYYDYLNSYYLITRALYDPDYFWNECEIPASINKMNENIRCDLTQFIYRDLIHEIKTEEIFSSCSNPEDYKNLKEYFDLLEYNPFYESNHDILDECLEFCIAQFKNKENGLNIFGSDYDYDIYLDFLFQRKYEPAMIKTANKLNPYLNSKNNNKEESLKLILKNSSLKVDYLTSMQIYKFIEDTTTDKAILKEVKKYISMS